MSDQGIAIDPFAGLPTDIPQSAAREAVAAIVTGNGVPITKANEALAARGFAPLNGNAQDYWAAQKDALLNDSQFAAAYTRGDPEAIAKLYQADLKISAASGKLLDTPMMPSDPAYDPVRREVGRNVTDAAAYDTYSTELSGLVASLGMPAENSATLTQDHFAAIKATAGMEPEAKQLWGDQQHAAFVAALGGEGAEEKIKTASKVLSDRSNKKLDLNAIAKSNGVRVAVNLYFQSQTLKGK